MYINIYIYIERERESTYAKEEWEWQCPGGHRLRPFICPRPPDAPTIISNHSFEKDNLNFTPLAKLFNNSSAFMNPSPSPSPSPSLPSLPPVPILPFSLSLLPSLSPSPVGPVMRRRTTGSTTHNTTGSTT